MTNVKDLIAGIFVLASLVLFLLFVGWAGRIQLFFEDRTEVQVLMPTLVPIAKGAPVRFEGMLVGDVRDIRLRSRTERQGAHPDYRAALTLSLRPDLEINRGTQVQVTADGMLGARYVAMQLGPDDAPPLGQGDLLLGSLAGIDSFLTRASALSERLDVLLARLGNLVAADGSPGSLPTLVEKVTSLVERTDTLLSGLEETRRNLDGGIADTRGIVRSADKILSENAGPLRELVAELAGLPEELTRTLDEYRQLAGGNKEGVSNLVAATHDTMNALRTTVDDVGAAGRQTLQRLDDLLVRNDRNLFLTLHNLRVAAEELKLAMARLRADPSQLLFGGSEDPAAAEAAARRSLERDVLDRGFLPPRWKR